METKTVPFTRMYLVAVHAVVVLFALVYFVVAHVAGETNDPNIGLGLSEVLMQVLGVPWSLVFYTAGDNAAYLIGCAGLNLALHAGWQFSRK